jgi:hypothetical protein
MGNGYKREPDIRDIEVLPADIMTAVCGDATRCTLALVGARVVGHPVTAMYDDALGEVTIRWDVPDGQGVRYHVAVVKEDRIAIRILLLTDLNKRRLLRSARSREPLRVSFEQHFSARACSRKRTPEQMAVERDRARELKELRAAGLASPPVHRRASKVSQGRGMRAIGTVPADA